MSSASCSHVGKNQAPPAAAAAAAVLTANVSGHLQPGTALLWTKTDRETDPCTEPVLISAGINAKFTPTCRIR